MGELDGPWLEPEEAEPRLILFAPATPSPEWYASLPALLDVTQPAALVAGTPGDTAALTALRQATRAATSALLVHDLSSATAAEADGAFFHDAGQVTGARRRFGSDWLIGVGCRSRHEAMDAGEAGADFVAFGAIDGSWDQGELADLVSWWSELFVLPAACLSAAEPRAVERLLAAGADLIGLGGALWDDPSSVAARLGEIAAVLGRAPRRAT